LGDIGLVFVGDDDFAGEGLVGILDPDLPVDTRFAEGEVVALDAVDVVEAEVGGAVDMVNEDGIRIREGEVGDWHGDSEALVEEVEHFVESSGDVLKRVDVGSGVENGEFRGRR
jgi:hypothetical protein